MIMSKVVDSPSESPPPQQDKDKPQTNWTWNSITGVNDNEGRLVSPSSSPLSPVLSSPNSTPDEDGDQDPLLKFYQALCPPQIRVFKRDHPSRRPEESDEAFERRWQLYEYAKLHPLTPQSYFYDIEVKDELLVPIDESSSITLSSSDSKIITTADASLQAGDNESGDDWENESIPGRTPISYSDTDLARKISDTCVKLHSTVSMFKLENVSKTSLPQLPNEQEEPVILPPKKEGRRMEKMLSTPNKEVAVHLPVPKPIPPPQKYPSPVHFDPNKNSKTLPSLRLLPRSSVKAKSFQSKTNTPQRDKLTTTGVLNGLLHHFSSLSMSPPPPNYLTNNNTEQRKQSSTPSSKHKHWPLHGSSSFKNSFRHMGSYDGQGQGKKVIRPLQLMYLRQQFVTERLYSGMPTTPKPHIRINKIIPHFCKPACRTLSRNFEVNKKSMVKG